MRGSGVWLLLLALSGAPVPAVRAVDLTEIPIEALMDLEVPKVYGASKIEQKTTEAPSSITVVNAEEIKHHGYRTLADILQSAQGFNVSYDRNYAFLGVRGVSLGDFNSRVLLLVNGHRVNNNLTDGAAIGTDFILDVDLIDRVEIIRGPGSVLYGNNAFFGVINVVTRTAQQLNGAEVSGEYGSFDAFKARATYGKQFTNGMSLLLSGTFYDQAGDARLFYKEFNTPAQNNGVAENLDADRYQSAFASLGYHDFTLEGGYISREKENPTAQYGTTFNDPRLRTTDDRAYANLKFSRSLPGEVTVNARLYYDSYDYEIGYPVGDPTAIAFYQERQAGEWWGTELQVDKQLWDRHTVSLGAEYRDDFHQQLQVFDQTTTYTDIQKDRQSIGIFAQADVAVRTNLHLNGGVRYDEVGDFDAAVNPRAALIYNPHPKSTLKFIYGSAYRAPNFTELGDPRFQNIKPEEINGYEVVYEQDIGSHLRTSVSGFINDMQDLIVLNSGSFTNFDTKTRGVELAVQGFWPEGIRARASYSYQRSDDPSLGWSMPDSPTHMVKLNVSTPLWQDKLFAGVEFQYTSDRLSLLSTTDPFGQPITVQGETADSYTIVNLTLYSQNLLKNLDWSVGLYNVFDQRYADPASRFHQQSLLERDGRIFRLKLTYHF